ncbi:hypothetical protein [Neobacillus drentensis]|uniref:hypothetical protein n=1 Tax=Neobacillus drentensis TaxID=220684 RepID=UPI00300358F4
MQMLDNWGLVSIYADRLNNLIIFPNGESKEGDTREIDVDFKVNDPFTEMELEDTLIKALELCHSKIPPDINELSAIESAIGKKGWWKVTKDLKYLSLYWNKSDGFLVKPYKRIPRKGYILLVENGISLGKKPEPGQLAAAVKKAIEFSRL